MKSDKDRIGLSVTSNLDKGRLKQVMTGAGVLALCCAGGLYLSRIGMGIPCVFHEVTGWDCPGCGITRMLRFLLIGNIAAAWNSNPVVMVAIPILIWLMVRLALRYVRTGNCSLIRGENMLVWVLIIGFIAFGILRNTHWYPY